MENKKRKISEALPPNKRLREDEDVMEEDSQEHLWERPPLPKIDATKDKITFQQFDATYTLQEPVSYMPGVKVGGSVPVILCYGVTENGNSVQCNIHGVLPYLYVRAPPNFHESDCRAFKEKLNNRVEASITNQGKASEYVLNVQLIYKESIMGYSPNPNSPFLKITLLSPKHVPTCRTILESGFNLPPYGDLQYQTFESNVPFVLRYMIDVGMVGGGWVELSPGDYVIRPESQKHSTCQLEIDVPFDGVKCHAPEGEWAKLSPFRILSFDIECAGRKGVFPEPEHDPVIQIANIVSVQGQNVPIAKNVFNLKSCSKIAGAHVLEFETEKDLLLQWRNFLQKVDPDIIIGYNIANFDFPYLINRAKKLNLERFHYLGRVKDSKAKVKDTTFSSKAYGTRESKETTIDGRVQLDILQVIQREHKLRSYSLNSVCTQFLGEQKEDVHHSDITDLFNGNSDDRRRLAVYCLKDAYLPLRLVEKLMIMYNYIEMARVTGVLIGYLLSRGQQIKVISQLYRKANAQNLLIPCYPNSKKDDDATYEGATVIEPKRGFYDTPITTLDFSSLYPSIMMAHNLCYSTLISVKARSLFPSESYEITPTNDSFIKSGVKKGVLPQILEELLEARKKAKEALKKETDPFKKACLDGRQLALKISANSVYGFTGATVGKLPCLEISSSVTAYGREMIEQTKQYVESHYCIENGFKYNATVIYGDTDSVMVKFGGKEVKEAMELGKQAASEITTTFPPPIQLVFEKVYYPYLLINKKRYAGLLWTNPEKYDKIDTKGIETVRRDNCPLVKNVITTCLNKILIDFDIEGAKEYTKGIISDLLQNKLDLSLLVITKALSKEGKDYSAKQAHVELAERMRKRDPHTAPAIGDRVPYVIIQAPKGSKAYEKSEDPLFVLENNIPLDYQYYVEQQLKNPLIRIFEPLMDDPTRLLVGEHTRIISRPTPKAGGVKGGIVGFTVKKLNCLGCKGPLNESKGEHTTCNNCRSRESELYQQQLTAVRSYEKQFAQTWTQCQVCQGSLHQPVLCSSRDCPIFYMRKKVQFDLEEAETLLQRFNIEW